MIIIVRSIVFNILFFFVLGTYLVLGMPLLLLDEKYTFLFWKKLSEVIDFLAQHVADIKYKIENQPNLADDKVLYAMRHESTWETLVMIHNFHDPVFVLKKELLDIPFFGALAKKSRSIDVDRNGGARSLITAAKRVEQTIAGGHPVVVFPEGTRVPAGEHAELKRGIALFYKKSNCLVIPIVHDSGKLWPRRGFIKKSGLIRVKFMDPILPGLSQDDFMDRLNSAFHSGIEELKEKNENIA